ncbi:MAG: tetratricopeptide repeat protein [Chloroflexi bacterium]|nr:tetratricopeptide repeat protein [Chloroflexota bacterium]
MSSWGMGDGIGEFGPIIAKKYGSMGIVYIVPDWDWKRIFAVKTYRDILGERGTSKFLEEALCWVNLEKHTNIVFANFVETVEEKLCIFLEYIENLKHLSYYIGKLDISQALDYAIQFCTGMVYAYNKRRIVHRDIKPDNIFVTPDGVLKISDFGLAKAIERLEKGQNRGSYTTTGYSVGALPYKAPEQYSALVRKRYQFPHGQITTRSDIYSFGVTFYQLMTKKLPLKVEEVFIKKKPINPCKLNKEIPEQLGALLMKCLEYNPADRYGSFTEVRRALIDVYSSLPEEQKAFGATYSVRGRKLPLTAVDWVSKGFSLTRLGRHNDAINCFRKAQKRNPKLVEAWLNEGACLMELGKHEEAIALFDKALGLYQFSTQAWALKVQALASLGRVKEAICCFSEALRKIALYSPEPLDTVEYFMRQGNYEQALSYCNKALGADPADRATLVKRAACLKAMGKNDEAIESLDVAMKMNSDNREYEYFRALAWNASALLDLGRDEEIFRWVKEELEMETERRMLLPLRWEKEEVPSRSALLDNIAFCDKVLKINRASYTDALWHKAMSLISLRRYQQAVYCLDEALKIGQENHWMWTDNGLALEMLGRYEDAIHCFEQALRTDPGQYVASTGKARLLAKLARREEMIEFLLELRRSAPKVLDEWVEQGEILLIWKGEHEKAIELFDMALTADGRMARAWGGKGSALMLLQRYVDAIHCFDKLLEINPRSSDGWYRKGVCLTYLDSHDEAKDCFLNFIKLAPPEKADLIKTAKDYLSQLGQKDGGR